MRTRLLVQHSQVLLTQRIGYYVWKTRPDQAKNQSESTADEFMLVLIGQFFEES